MKLSCSILRYPLLGIIFNDPILFPYALSRLFLLRLKGTNLDSNRIEATRSRTNGAAKVWAVSSHGALIWSNFVFDKLLVY